MKSNYQPCYMALNPFDLDHLCQPAGGHSKTVIFHLWMDVGSIYSREFGDKRTKRPPNSPKHAPSTGTCPASLFVGLRRRGGHNAQIWFKRYSLQTDDSEDISVGSTDPNKGYEGKLENFGREVTK